MDLVFLWQLRFGCDFSYFGRVLCLRMQARVCILPHSIRGLKEDSGLQPTIFSVCGLVQELTAYLKGRVAWET